MSPPCDGTDEPVDCCRCFSGDNGGFHNESCTAWDEQICPHCGKSGPSSLSYCSFRNPDLGYDKDWEKLRRCVAAATKGFAIGAGLRGGLAAFSIVARWRRGRPSLISRKAGAIPNSEAIVIAIKDTLRYGLFLGTFAGTFVSVDECIAALGGHRRHDGKVEGTVGRAYRWPFDAFDWTYTAHKLGHIHSFASFYTSFQVWDKEQTIRTHLQTFDVGAWRHLSNVPLLFPNSVHRVGEAEILLGGVQDEIYAHHYNELRSAYLLKQDSLHPSYRSFLNKHGGKDSVILQGVSEIASGMPFTNLEGIEKYYKSKGVNIKLDPQMKVPCSIIHGHQSCTAHIISFFIQSYGRALTVYLPVYLVPALIVHRLDFLKSPNTILGKGLRGTARSSLFLSAYCSSAWMWTCFLFRIFKWCNIPMVAMGTFPTGLTLAFEKKSRRIEISLYCFARAIESFFTCMVEAGLLTRPKRVKRADVVIFSLSTAIIMHCYAQEREVFRSKYLNVLDWVFGVPPMTCETPPSKNGEEVP